MQLLFRIRGVWDHFPFLVYFLVLGTPKGDLFLLVVLVLGVPGLSGGSAHRAGPHAQS